MKIKLFRTTNLVSSIHVEQAACGLRIIFNMNNRNATVFYRGGSVELKEAIDHRCFVVIEHDDEEDEDEDDNDEYAIDKTLEIVLIPETDAEKKALMEQHFFSQEKEQVVVQYIKRSLLECTETLVDWPIGQ